MLLRDILKTDRQTDNQTHRQTDRINLPAFVLSKYYITEEAVAHPKRMGGGFLFAFSDKIVQHKNVTAQ